MLNVKSEITYSSRTKSCGAMRYAFGMAKKRKFKWDRKPCGCVKTELVGERAVIRCGRHQEKPAKGRAVRYWVEGQVRREP